MSEQKLTPHQLWREQMIWKLDALTDATRELRDAGELDAVLKHLDAHPSCAPGMALVPDWKGYALLGTGRYCLENSAAPPDPQLGAELIIRPATDKDTAGGRQLYEERDTDGGPIQPEVMAVRIGFLSASALDALEAQLRHLRAENFPESVPVAKATA